MRKTFDGQLAQLHSELAQLGALCEQAIAKAARAFLSGDATLAAEVQEHAAQIDRREREVETLCLKLLLRQQPVAADLRVISAALKMVTDMERIGNQSADIADIVQKSAPPAQGETYSEMARGVIFMVDESVDAFLHADTEKARSVIAYDDVVDGAFLRVKDELIARIRVADPCSANAADLLMVAKYLERIGDHAVNIAKWVVFSVTGELG